MTPIKTNTKQNKTSDPFLLVKVEVVSLGSQGINLQWTSIHLPCV